MTHGLNTTFLLDVTPCTLIEFHQCVGGTSIYFY